MRTLRSKVRRFLAAERDGGPFRPSCLWYQGHSPERGDRGWLGKTWPRRYGGCGRCAQERFRVIEELLAAGALVAPQVRGAIGFTTEHQLHLHTRRLIAWRDEEGPNSKWAAKLGARVTGAGPGGLWELMTSHPAVGTAR